MVLESWPPAKGLPNTESIRNIIAECYRLSFEPEEGRYPRLILAALGIDVLPEPKIRLGERPRFLHEIVTVAPAIAPPPFALALSVETATRCEYIINVASVAREPGIFWGIRGPGEVEVETFRDDYGAWRRKAWILTRGVCRPVRDIRESPFFQQLCASAAPQTDYELERVSATVRDLVYTISRRRRGGALVFVENRPIGATSPEIDFAVHPVSLLSPDAAPSLQTQILSCLTQMDGAVLVDAEFRVLGAGVFLDQAPIEVVEATSEGEGLPVDIRRLGSRHRSAAWFCGQNPGAYAIVISKDQVIRIFRRSETGDRVVVDGPYMDSMIEVARSGGTLPI